MSATTATAPGSAADTCEAWVPMITIALGPSIMSFDVAALPVSMRGMGAGHVHEDAAPVLGAMAERIPVVLASRLMTGLVFTNTSGYPGAEIAMIVRGRVPAGYLSGLKASLLLGLLLRETTDRAAIGGAFAVFG